MPLFDGMGAAEIMANIQVEIRGLDKFSAKIDSVVPALKTGIKAATVHIAEQMRKYPPQTMANKPKTYKTGQQNTWYQRGWGQKWAERRLDWHCRQ